ncbi:hypothetical protein [Azospirillum sp.]|uniref:hypothetical protein n=1 Tax=Azospirillum sp. TaxID=34012 RepID=UPI002D5605EE|nr:hypothetical protein [Azospirillum sp.]HYD70700.1 hypothetical protein [Azospirillum sp.]
MATMNMTRPTTMGAQTAGTQGSGMQGGPGGGQGGMGGPAGGGQGGPGGGMSGGTSGGPGGGHGGEGHGAGGPPSVDAVSTWVDDVLSDGGFTATGTTATRIDKIADALDEAVQSGGTDLPQAYVRALESTIRDLRSVAQNGDKTLGDGSGDTEHATVMAKAVDKLETFLENEGDSLSAEATTRLQSVLDSMNTIYSDGAVSTAEQTTLKTVADDLCDVLIEDFTKLSDAGLAALNEQASDLHTLADTGFLALDDAQRAVLTQAQTALDAIDTTNPDRTAVHDVMDDLRSGLGGELLSLAMPQRTIGLTGQSTSADTDALWA